MGVVVVLVEWVGGGVLVGWWWWTSLKHPALALPIGLLKHSPRAFDAECEMKVSFVPP